MVNKQKKKVVGVGVSVIVVCVLPCSVGYFIDPTIIETTNPKSKLMEEVSESAFSPRFCGCVELLNCLSSGNLWACHDLLRLP